VNIKSAKNAFLGTGVCIFYMCEGYGNGGTAFVLSGTCRMIYCRAYNSAIGISSGTGVTPAIMYSAIVSCNVGLSLPNNANYMSVVNSVFYKCPTAINLNGSKRGLIVDSIFHTSSTVALTDSTNNDQTQIKCNVFYNNLANGANVTIDSTNILSDPLLTDPDNGNFILKNGSTAFGATCDFTGVGLLGDYGGNIGLDQNNQPQRSWAY
jgi:hypothetical protein